MTGNIQTHLSSTVERNGMRVDFGDMNCRRTSVLHYSDAVRLFDFFI
jgi:hypothetical protein